MGINFYIFEIYNFKYVNYYKYINSINGFNYNCLNLKYSDDKTSFGELDEHLNNYGHKIAADSLNKNIQNIIDLSECKKNKIKTGYHLQLSNNVKLDFYYKGDN